MCPVRTVFAVPFSTNLRKTSSKRRLNFKKRGQSRLAQSSTKERVLVQAGPLFHDEYKFYPSNRSLSGEIKTWIEGTGLFSGSQLPSIYTCLAASACHLEER